MSLCSRKYVYSDSSRQDFPIAAFSAAFSGSVAGASSFEGIGADRHRVDPGPALLCPPLRAGI
eukprot:2060187-Alexandrium_andersonii.AAC.1